jgi:WD40 repeat protein
MAERAQRHIKIIIPNRSFHDDCSKVTALAVFPDGRRVVTSWAFDTLCLWDLKDRVVLRKIDVGRGWLVVAVSGDGQLIASGDQKGELIAWHGDTNKSPTQTIQGHSKRISSLDFSPDGAVLASGSSDQTTKLWCTKTWHMQGNPIECGRAVNCVRFSPSGELLAIATDGRIEVWNPRTSTCVTKLKGHVVIKGAWNNTLTWTPDGTRLLSGGSAQDPTIREWNTSTWKQVGDPWSGHTDQIKALTVNSTGTFVASASNVHVRLWHLSDERTVTIFKHSQPIQCITFSLDGEHIFIVGFDNEMSEWAVPKDVLEELARNKVNSL